MSSVGYHEPIDDFLAPDGKVGMNSMSMPFPLAKGVSMSGIAPGDVVEVRLAVWTAKGDLGYEARAVKKLPPETALHFGLASPPLPGVKP